MESEDCIYLASNEEVLFDFNYRYKIIKPIFELVSKKGKPLTLLSNLDLFCAALEFNTEMMLKVISQHLSCESGTVKETGTHYLKGNYEDNVLMEIICNFIKKYLLCKGCDKPEVILSAQNKSELEQECKACGNKQTVEYDGTVYDIIIKKLNSQAKEEKKKNKKK